MLQNAADSNVNSSTVYEHRREQKMSDEWNWGQEPEKTDGSSQQPENTDESGSAASDQTAAPEDWDSKPLSLDEFPEVSELLLEA